MGIPRILVIVLFILISLVVTVLMVINFFAPKFGLEKDQIITWLFSLLAGAMIKFVLPSKDTKKDEEENDRDERGAGR